MTYNGWKNRSTWAAHMHATSTSPILEKLFRECKEVGDVRFFIETLFGDGWDGIRVDEVDFERLLEAAMEV